MVTRCSTGPSAANMPSATAQNVMAKHGLVLEFLAAITQQILDVELSLYPIKDKKYY